MESKSLPAVTEALTETYLPAVTQALSTAQELAKKWRKVPIAALLLLAWEEDEGAQYVAVAFDPAATPEQLCQQMFPKYEQNGTLASVTHIQIRFIVDGEELAKHFPGGEDYPVYDENAAPLVKLPAGSPE